MRKIHLKTASMLIPVRKMATFPYSKWLLSATEEHLEHPLLLRVAEEVRGTWPLPSGRKQLCPAHPGQEQLLPSDRGWLCACTK